MTEAESRKLEEYLQGVATILFKNTPEEQLKDFGSIELAGARSCAQRSCSQDWNFF